VAVTARPAARSAATVNALPRTRTHPAGLRYRAHAQPRRASRRPPAVGRGAVCEGWLYGPIPF